MKELHSKAFGIE